VLQGDEASFEELVRRFHGPMLRLACGFVRDRAVAEQDAWVGVLKGLSGFEGRAALKTWIFRIVVNRARTRGSREARSVPFSGLENAGLQGSGMQGADEAAVDPSRFDERGMWSQPPSAWQAETPESLMVAQETGRVIEAAIAAMPPNQRIVLTLRDIEGLSSEEVCNLLAITETNQRVLLQRARSRVHKALALVLDGG